MNNNNTTRTASLLFILLLFSLFLSIQAFAVDTIEQLLPLQGKVTLNGNIVDDGNVTVRIYDSESSGTQIWTDDFNNSIQDGFFDVHLGEKVNVTLNNSKTYWLDLEINGQDLDFDGQERKIFQSPIGYDISGDDNFTVDTNVLFIDSVNDRVGIGIINPNYPLDVLGNINATNLNLTGNIRAGDLSSCTALETDSEGNFICGTDNVIDTDQLNLVNTSMLDNNTILRVINITNGDVNNITLLSQLANDAGYITSFDTDPLNIVNLSMLDNDTIIRVFNITALNTSNVTLVSQLENDAGFITSGSFQNNSDINVTRFVANNTLFVNDSSVGIRTETQPLTETLTVQGNASVHNLSVRTVQGTGGLIFHNGSGICINGC